MSIGPELCELYDEMIKTDEYYRDSTNKIIDESTNNNKKINDRTDDTNAKLDNLEETTIIKKKDSTENYIKPTNSFENTNLEMNIPLDNTYITLDISSYNLPEINNESNNTINDDNKNDEKHNQLKLTFIIIISILLVIIIILIILLLYCFKCKNNQFNHSNKEEYRINNYPNEIRIKFASCLDDEFSIYINRKKKIRDVIDKYYKIKGRGIRKSFLLNGINLNLENNMKKRIDCLVQGKIFDDELVIVVSDYP